MMTVKPSASLAKEPKLRAFAVTDRSEGTGGIVFARHAIVARREGACTFGDGDFESVECRRAPWADDYAGDSLPAWVLIDNGWHYEDAWTGETIDTDYLDERGLPIKGVIGTQHSLVFACQAHADAYATEETQRKAVEAKGIEEMQAIVLKRFPDALLTPSGSAFSQHAYASKDGGEFVLKQVIVSFEFPGMKIGPASARYDRPYNEAFEGLKPVFWCCGGDKEAFEAWAALSSSPEGAVLNNPS
jgi:hypothetical protein